MRYRTIAPVVLAAFCGTSTVGARQGEFTAKADIKGAGITGTAELREISAMRGNSTASTHTVATKAVEIVITVTGLTPGAHGMHLHAVGRCEAPFTSAGGHFDPGPASNTNPDVNHPFHMGDVPNLVADASGRASMTVMTTRVTLGPGPLSIFDDDGTAIIVHGNPDQGIPGAAGSGVSGGPRVACGVIVRQ